MFTIQRARFDVLPLYHATECGTRESRPADADEVPHTGGLNGEVIRQGNLPHTTGLYWEVWKGQLKKCRGVGGRKEETDEKVSLSLTPSIILTRLFVGGFESTPRGKVV